MNKIMHKIIVFLFLVAISVNTGCDRNFTIGAGGFFAWMDGYLSMHSEDEFTFALTYFYERDKKPFETNDIITVSFENLDQIEISNYIISPLDSDLALPYDGFIFELTVKPKEIGLFKTDGLVANISNSYITFPIGQWVFDIVDVDLTDNTEDQIDIWESPAAGSNPREFAYDYTLKNDTAKISELWISETVCISDEEGVAVSNEIELPEIMNAPLNFIRPKIIIDTNGRKSTAFGMSYYCGAMNIPESVLEASRKHNMVEKF